MAGSVSRGIRFPQKLVDAIVKVAENERRSYSDMIKIMLEDHIRENYPEVDIDGLRKSRLTSGYDNGFAGDAENKPIDQSGSEKVQ